MARNCSQAGRARRKQEFLKWGAREKVSRKNFVQEFEVHLQWHFIWDLTSYATIQNISSSLSDQGSKPFGILTDAGPLGNKA